MVPQNWKSTTAIFGNIWWLKMRKIFFLVNSWELWLPNFNMVNMQLAIVHLLRSQICHFDVWTILFFFSLFLSISFLFEIHWYCTIQSMFYIYPLTLTKVQGWCQLHQTFKKRHILDNFVSYPLIKIILSPVWVAFFFAVHSLNTMH